MATTTSAAATAKTVSGNRCQPPLGCSIGPVGGTYCTAGRAAVSLP